MAYFDRKRKLDKQDSNQESDAEGADGNSEAASSKTSARQKRKTTRQISKRR